MTEREATMTERERQEEGGYGLRKRIGMCGSRALGMCVGSVQGAIARQEDAWIMLALDWQATG